MMTLDDVIFILAIAIAIIIHEAGHYVFARVFGVRVKRVSLFFNPFFTLLKYNSLTGRLDLLSVKKYLSSIKNDEEIVAEATHSVLSIRITNPVDNVEAWDKRTGHLFRPERFEVNSVIMNGKGTEETRQWRLTQYCIGWLPFGGYVTMDNEGPDGLFSKKTHQQVLVNLGGIIFNMAAVLIVIIGLLLVRKFLGGALPSLLEPIVMYSVDIMGVNWLGGGPQRASFAPLGWISCIAMYTP